MKPTSTCPPPRAGRITAAAGLVTLASLFMAACGGDFDHPTPPAPAPTPTPAPAPTPVEMPASATVDPESLFAYALSLTSDETSEPVYLDNVGAFPTSDTTEPFPLPS